VQSQYIASQRIIQAKFDTGNLFWIRGNSTKEFLSEIGEDAVTPFDRKHLQVEALDASECSSGTYLNCIPSRIVSVGTEGADANSM
jgi:hypothetical protein